MIGAELKVLRRGNARYPFTETEQQIFELLTTHLSLEIPDGLPIVPTLLTQGFFDTGATKVCFFELDRVATARFIPQSESC